MMPGVIYRRNVTQTKVEVSPNRIALRGLLFHNDDAAAAYLQIFDKVIGNVTVGTTVPDAVVRLAADSFIEVNFFNAIFENGITIAVTTTAEGSTGGALNHLAFMVL